MKYEDYRSKIQTGDIIGFSRSKPVAAIIKFFTKSIYSHVGTAFVAYDRVYVIEAVQPYIRIYPLSRLLPFYHCSINKELNQNALDFLHSTVGDRYSIKDCIRAYLAETTTDNRWQCAEHVRYAQRLNGQIVNSKATPGAIMNWADKFNGTMLVK